MVASQDSEKNSRFFFRFSNIFPGNLNFQFQDFQIIKLYIIVSLSYYKIINMKRLKEFCIEEFKQENISANIS